MAYHVSFCSEDNFLLLIPFFPYKARSYFKIHTEGRRRPNMPLQALKLASCYSLSNNIPTWGPDHDVAQPWLLSWSGTEIKILHQCYKRVYNKTHKKIPTIKAASQNLHRQNQEFFESERRSDHMNVCFYLVSLISSAFLKTRNQKLNHISLLCSCSL